MKPARSPRRHARPAPLAPHAPAAVSRWITEAALAAPTALREHLMQRLSISARRAGALLRQLEALGWLRREGSTRRPRHSPGALRQVVRRYELAMLQEDEPWRRDFAPCFALPPNVTRLVRHAFTELLNNAIDHSGGESVTVSLRQTPLQAQLLVSDDGVGLFERVAASHGIREPALAMLELGKGRLTSAPARHLGQGLASTARTADVLDLHANAAAFQCRGFEQHGWRAGRGNPAAARAGTSIYVAFAIDTTRTVEQALAELSAAGDGLAFDRTRVPLGLLAGEGGVLESRAEARRVAMRLAQFRRAELDFSGVEHIGPAFADELFRVIAREQPEVLMVPTGMRPAVQAMARAASERV